MHVIEHVVYDYKWHYNLSYRKCMKLEICFFFLKEYVKKMYLKKYFATSSIFTEITLAIWNMCLLLCQIVNIKIIYVISFSINIDKIWIY